MKKIISVLILFLLINVSAQSQNAKTEKKSFSSQISAGITEAQQGTSFHIEILNGIRYKTWFGGIGAGLDYYYLRSIPLYLSGIKYLSQRNHSFFVQGDAGVNFAWEDQSFNVWNEVDHDFKPGLFWNGILGFATGLDRKNSFSFGVGYSQKRLKEIKEIVAAPCFNPPCENSFETYRYNLNRLTLRIGWQFNYSR